MRTYLFRKLHQLKNVSWFLAGFFFGSGLNAVSVICLVLAVVCDFLSTFEVSKSTP